MVAPSKNEEIQGSTDQTCDRKSELQAFDDTKTGVKGLFDAGITKLPRIFIHPPENVKDIKKNPTEAQFDFPMIDLEGYDKDSSIREKIVDRVREAVKTWGFFQVINHGIPARILEEMLDGVRRFMKLDTEVKKQYYTRDLMKKFRFNCNFDLFSSPIANWRDSIFYDISPNPPQPEELPAVCR